MQTKRRVLIAAVLAAAVTLGACGSSGSDSKPAADQSATTSVSGTTGASTDAAGSDTTTADATGDPSAIEWVPETGTGDVTVTWTTDDTFDPDRVEIGVGDIVEVAVADGGSTTAVGVNANGDDAKTITPGMTESFTFTKAGTYSLYEALHGGELVVDVS